MNNGYIVNQTVNPVTWIQSSYQKFKTKFGTYVSFKKEIWDPVTQSYDNDRLKLINFPVLKSHMQYGGHGIHEALHGRSICEADNRSHKCLL